MKENPNQNLSVDLLTVFCIALLVTSCTVAFHEGVHAFVCIITGGTLLEFSAQHIDCNATSVAARKLVSGSAAVANMIIGVIIYRLLREPNRYRAVTKFTLWLFMLVNLTSGVGYLAFSGIMGVGDYATVIDGWEPAWLWRVLMTVLGLVLFMLCVGAALMAIGRFIGGVELKEQVNRLQWVGVAAFAGAFVVALGAGLMNPYGITGLPAIAGMFAIAGAQSPLLWMAQWFQAKMFKKNSAEINLSFERSWPHVVAGILAFAIYTFILGPGLTF